jgi:hypothetical protein
MPNIETPDELADEILNWVGCFGCCPAEENGQDTCENKNPFCCRVGAMTWLPDRIRASVENEKKLNQ